MDGRVVVIGALAGCVWSAAAYAQRCEARSAARPPAIVELYTSEGCSSCPPADRWLTGLKGRGDVLALAFHVNYWDRLGWPDRFATPATTERQHQLAQGSGSGYVYTPQVIVNGADLRQWSGSTPHALPATPVTLELQRNGTTVTARVGTAAGAASNASSGKRTGQLAGYWAVLEDGHTSRVRAGENAGQVLRHDHVVVQYQPVQPWSADAVPAVQWTLAPPTPLTPLTPGIVRRVAFVVTDALSRRPLQALALDC